MQSKSTKRRFAVGTVAGCGLALTLPLHATLIDDFERDLLEDNEAWLVGGDPGTGNEIVDDGTGTGNRALSFWEDGDGGNFTQLARVDLGDNAIDEGATGTFFQRFRVNDPDAGATAHLFGLSNVDTDDEEVTGNPRNSDFLQTQLVALNHDTTTNHSDPSLDGRSIGANEFNLRVTSGPLATDWEVNDLILEQETWYNLWLVVDNDAKTYQLYLNEDPGDGTLVDASGADLVSFGGMDTFGFKAGVDPEGALTHWMGHAGNDADNDTILMDDFHAMDGVNLTNPIPEPGSLALLGAGGLMLLARRRR